MNDALFILIVILFFLVSYVLLAGILEGYDLLETCLQLSINV